MNENKSINTQRELFMTQNEDLMKNKYNNEDTLIKSNKSICSSNLPIQNIKNNKNNNTNYDDNYNYNDSINKKLEFISEIKENEIDMDQLSLTNQLNIRESKLLFSSTIIRIKLIIKDLKNLKKKILMSK